jgi:hypothetical protein
MVGEPDRLGNCPGSTNGLCDLESGRDCAFDQVDGNTPQTGAGTAPESIQQRTLHSVLGMEIGSAIKMTQADFVRPYKACFAQVEAKFT